MRFLRFITAMICAVISFGTVSYAEELISGSRIDGLLATGNSFIVCDRTTNRILKILPNGKTELIAGTRFGAMKIDGSYKGGYKNGDRSTALFSRPKAVAKWKSGYVVADSGNNALRYITNEEVTTLSKSLDNPSGLAADGLGNVYIADTGNNRIVKLDKSGRLTAVAGKKDYSGLTDGKGTKARFNEPYGLSYQNGMLYIADSGNNAIRRYDVKTKAVVTVYGGDMLANPQGIAADGNTLYVTDTLNARVLKLTAAAAPTVVNGTDFVSPSGIIIYNNSLYVTDSYLKKIIIIDLKNKN